MPAEEAERLSRIVERRDFTPTGFRWLGLSRITWEGPDGRRRFWEAARRSSRKGDVDGVAIIAKVQARGEPLKVILESQFRPSQGNYVIELPAGLVDAGEDAAASAVRELREETGYSGRVFSVSPICYSDPGMTDANMQFVEINVDANSPDNVDVNPQLEEGEFIEVFLLPFAGLYSALVELQKEKGWDVDARLLMYAAGLELGGSLAREEANGYAAEPQPKAAADTTVCSHCGGPPDAQPPAQPAQVMDMVANAAPVEIARWRSGDLEERPEAASEQDGDGGALGTSASKQSLFAAAGLEGAAGNGGSAVGAPAEPASGPPVVVTPEELRRHGIDRVRIIPRGSLKWHPALDRYTLTAAGIGLAVGVGITQVLAGLALAMGMGSYNPRVRLRW